MELSFEAILYYLVLVDAISAVVASWTSYGVRMNKRFSIFGHYFPVTKGWTTYYLVLVVWLGFAFVRLGVI